MAWLATRALKKVDNFVPNVVDVHNLVTDQIVVFINPIVDILVTAIVSVQNKIYAGKAYLSVYLAILMAVCITNGCLL